VYVTYDLKLHRLPIKLDSPDLEVHANRRDVALCVRIVGEPQQQAGLSDARVTDEEELEEVVVSAIIAYQRLRIHIQRIHQRQRSTSGL